jgi:hypothetical protein
MTATLTAQDFAMLEQFATQGDRYDYWGYLAARGDRYASLAQGVVTGATSDGYTANQYAASYASAKNRRTGSSLDLTVFPVTIPTWHEKNGVKRTGSSLDIAVFAVTIAPWHALYA